mgnify:CR=1 FL=1
MSRGMYGAATLPADAVDDPAQLAKAASEAMLRCGEDAERAGGHILTDQIDIELHVEPGWSLADRRYHEQETARAENRPAVELHRLALVVASAPLIEPETGTA